MKRSALTLLAVAFLFSCKKSTSSAPGTSGLVTAYTVYSAAGHHLIQDSLTYDADRHLARLTYREYDTSGNLPDMDTGSYYFTWNPNTQLPSSYTLVWYKSIYPVPSSETHNLSFDSQGRMIRDTTMTGQSDPTDSMANYYVYNGNVIVCNNYGVYAYDPVDQIYGWGKEGEDSLFLNNGNLVQQSEYSENGASWQQNFSWTINSYTNYTNPLYTQHLSTALGAFFIDEQTIDILSMNLPSDGMTKWTTDANGRVVSGLGTDGTITTFTYQ